MGIMSQMVLWVSTAHNGVLKKQVCSGERVIPSIFCAKSDNGRINTTLYFYIMVLCFPYKKSLLLDQFYLWVICGLVVMDVSI